MKVCSSNHTTTQLIQSDRYHVAGSVSSLDPSSQSVMRSDWVTSVIAGKLLCVVALALGGCCNLLEPRRIV
ncbi:hypothetical protein BgiMline_006887 [Biomphalaria glabrata]